MRNFSSFPEKFSAAKTKPMLLIISCLILCGALRALCALVNSAELPHMASVDRTPLLLSHSEADIEPLEGAELRNAVGAAKVSPQSSLWQSASRKIRAYKIFPRMRKKTSTGNIYCGDLTMDELMEEFAKLPQLEGKIDGIPSRDKIAKLSRKKRRLALATIPQECKKEESYRIINNIVFPYHVVYIYLLTKHWKDTKDEDGLKEMVKLALVRLLNIYKSSYINDFDLSSAAEAAFSCIVKENPDILKDDLGDTDNALYELTISRYMQLLDYK
ncbi:uncharacterized protein PGTG_15796 [Puccinia graminis f. sp. tritici CRL 75-36-700-3]|uniref:Uncharacterized protein n=2 Tax=Puccinia graminis f. sp. tritici TaxID=56615 RepID=E3KZV9_PUCGT|nr:uncharacterized protein PGTG_15796 [Puccinia graminis f. sp. tritici CRL 75-36-700-3]EFP89840.2 hypothetical protein PGTG_15796 [Puccinia graminis f. sp. tritici CRL 75-36-700-3]